MLKAQRRFEPSSVWIGDRLFELKVCREVLMTTPWPAIGSPGRVVFTVDQKLSGTDHSCIFVRTSPWFAHRLLRLGEVGDSIGNFDFFPLGIWFIERLCFDEDFTDGKRAASTSARPAKG